MGTALLIGMAGATIVADSKQALALAQHSADQMRSQWAACEALVHEQTKIVQSLQTIQAIVMNEERQDDRVAKEAQTALLTTRVLKEIDEQGRGLQELAGGRLSLALLGALPLKELWQRLNRDLAATHRVPIGRDPSAILRSTPTWTVEQTDPHHLLILLHLPAKRKSSRTYNLYRHIPTPVTREGKTVLLSLPKPFYASVPDGTATMALTAEQIATCRQVDRDHFCHAPIPSFGGSCFESIAIRSPASWTPACTTFTSTVPGQAVVLNATSLIVIQDPNDAAVISCPGSTTREVRLNTTMEFSLGTGCSLSTQKIHFEPTNEGDQIYETVTIPVAEFLTTNITSEAKPAYETAWPDLDKLLSGAQSVYADIIKGEMRTWQSRPKATSSLSVLLYTLATCAVIFTIVSAMTASHHFGNYLRSRYKARLRRQAANERRRVLEEEPWVTPSEEDEEDPEIRERSRTPSGSPPPPTRVRFDARGEGQCCLRSTPRRNHIGSPARPPRGLEACRRAGRLMRQRLNEQDDRDDRPSKTGEGPGTDDDAQHLRKINSILESEFGIPAPVENTNKEAAVKFNPVLKFVD